MSDCLFCKIVAEEIPAKRVYESEQVIGFQDLHPAAPVHVLFIPKQHIGTINDLQSTNAALVGELFLGAQAYAKEQGFDEAGYRVVMNCNEQAGQTVFHIHLHLLAGRDFTWPPG